MAGIDSGRPVTHERPELGLAVAAAVGTPRMTRRATRAEAPGAVRTALPPELAGGAHGSGGGSACRRAARAAGRIDHGSLLHLTAAAKRRARDTT
jgi:hypothetical protein